MVDTVVCAHPMTLTGQVSLSSLVVGPPDLTVDGRELGRGRAEGENREHVLSLRHTYLEVDLPGRMEHEGSHRVSGVALALPCRYW